MLVGGGKVTLRGSAGCAHFAAAWNGADGLANTKPVYARDLGYFRI